MEEVIADLECHVAAEMTGRKAAEKEAVERGERIKQLEGMESELKNVMNEKQSIIRDMEREMTLEKESREKEVGVMNVRVGELSSNLEEAVNDLAKLEQDKKRLIERIEEEKAAGRRSMDAVHAKTMQWAKDIELIRGNHVNEMQRRETEVAEHRGLLTPVSACKYKDVAGYVEVRRGKTKRRPDSGIGILEEFEDEDLMVEDV
jgi:chromosome segregation ATPase